MADLIHFFVKNRPQGLRVLWSLCLGAWLGWAQAQTATVPADETLVIGGRTVHTFRAPLGMFTPRDRADGARRRIEQVFEQAGEGWTSVRSTELGLQIELDGRPLFMVLPGDARSLAGETPQDLAQQASRVVQKAWSEARERRDARRQWQAALQAAAALAVLGVALLLWLKGMARARRALGAWLQRLLGSARVLPWHAQTAALLPSAIDRVLMLLTWLLVLVQCFVFLTYTLGLFALTRPLGEGLSQTLWSLGGDALAGVAQAVPGVFVACVIFMLAWAVTRVSGDFFAQAESRSGSQTLLNAHTAPATRRLAHGVVWLFALAMAYPYLPGAHTEAFKGLTVMVGLMASLGASGVFGQMASGVIIVYTHALRKGEYVRIQDCEGTVTDLGLFVTRLRTGMGEEIALPNAWVLGNVTRNFSRVQGGSGYVLDTTVTIGYDTPWRQVHALLIEAAGAVTEVCADPPPYVVQTALSDFYVAYKLVVCVNADAPATRARVASDLHAAIQDSFNRYGVQIMSPHYWQDPAQAKTVAPPHWHSAPAVK